MRTNHRQPLSKCRKQVSDVQEKHGGGGGGVKVNLKRDTGSNPRARYVVASESSVSKRAAEFKHIPRRCEGRFQIKNKYAGRI